MGDVCNRSDHEPPVEGARTIAFDLGHDDLLRDAEVHKFVAELLRGNIHGDPV